MTKYRFRTRPYKHQYEAVKRMVKQERGALLMEPRTGKTKTTIDWLCALATKGAIDRAVIVAPNRVLGTWEAEFEIHAPLNYRLTVWDKDARAEGPPPPVRGEYDLEVVVVNYEAFGIPGHTTASGRRSKTSGRFLFRKVLRKWIDGQPCAGVIDESHKIKSPSGKVANLIVSMVPDFRYRLALTGTPLTKAKRPHDIYMQWKFINPDRFSHVPTVAEFKDHYSRFVDTGNGFKKYKGPKNQDELVQLMREDAVVVRRSECFDLPPREDVVRFVQLSSKTKKVYDEMAKELIAELETGTVAEAQIMLVRNMRLAQLTSGFVTDENGDNVRIGHEKSDALSEILSEAFENEEHMVVAARWVDDLDLIEKLGRSIGFKTYSIRGSVSRKQSDSNIRAFRAAKEPSLMVLQPSAAALGIDLSTAPTMVWYSHTNSWVDFSQTCDRVALSPSPTTFIHLVVENSVDESTLETLRVDGDQAARIMSNPRQALTGHSLEVDEHSRIKMVE